MLLNRHTAVTSVEVASHIVRTSLFDFAEQGECPVCLEQLTHAARILPCGHCVCFGCCVRLLDSSKRARAEAENGGVDGFVCPSCGVFCAAPAV